jgi:guanosine-3',5'-bis(diphosphate) 3'-pyrophosphohydrolase
MALDLTLGKSKNYDYWPELEKYAIETGLNKDLVKKCYDFAFKAHEGQKRISGEDYISHPAWVAKVITQLGIGHKSVFAALLHDCVEDTSVTIEDIEKEFDEETALLVSGLTEIRQKTKGIEVHQTSLTVFRRFLFSSVNDVRILIIRIIDKLHNGLTIGYLPKEKQIRYAKRIMGIYAPVAEYVGLHYFKRMLDDIAFEILYPKESNKLKRMIKAVAPIEGKALRSVKRGILKLLEINRIEDCEIQGRIKSLYSTYVKLKTKGEGRIKDRVGLRVITKDVKDCYTILGLLHSKYNYLPDEFNDYISTPKANGYRSIQTTIKWSENLTVEIQIRTKEMHEFDEFGPASHIVYKLNKEESGGVGMEWVRDLVKWQIGDNIKNYQINVLKEYIYVFTPKGDTIQLPKGSTVIDFAYRIHTDVGDYCKGVKINQKMAKINTVLKTGDLVEIITGKKKNANHDWLNFAKTNWAKSNIKKMQPEQYK